MHSAAKSKLNKRKRYLQLAFNSTLEDAQNIIADLPLSDRIILEAGTPLVKRYGMNAVSKIAYWYQNRINSFGAAIVPYIVADLKTMDRGRAEVEMAQAAGATAVVALGSAPVETLNAFIENCESVGVDAMIDMMNVEYPVSILAKLKKLPPVVILHRGVDEEQFNREKQIPWHEIQRIKGAYDIMISIAGGDTIREVQRSIFNSADIVVVWKSVFSSSDETIGLIEGFLKAIK